MKSLIFISPICFFLLNSCSTSKDNTISDVTTKATLESSDTKDYFGNYSIIDSSYKTQTIVKVEKEYRVMSTNALPNHKT
jgi:major membrane immunogen (membrane-anchored lipoprotein)